MTELQNDQLAFRFPEIEEALHDRLGAWYRSKTSSASEAEIAWLGSRENFLAQTLRKYGQVRAHVRFVRTLRIPDDGKSYPLPPGLGSFPLRHVDDIAGLPPSWRKAGGVAFPMHAAEAMWLGFRCSNYPLILRVAAGGICAVTGQKWETGLTRRPQNYLHLAHQPWLDGFRIDEDNVRQFIAMPLGKGLTVESELTGEETWGGLQLQAFPLKLERYWQSILVRLEADWKDAVAEPRFVAGIDRTSCLRLNEDSATYSERGMGLGAGGKMRQHIYEDDQGIDSWDRSVGSRCYVRLCPAQEWTTLTGEKTPHEPPSAKVYSAAGLPWFSYESDAPAVTGGTSLSGISSVNKLMKQKVGIGLPDNVSLSHLQMKAIKAQCQMRVRKF